MVLPAPGAPMKTYQGRSYRYRCEPRDRILVHSDGRSPPNGYSEERERLLEALVELGHLLGPAAGRVAGLP